MPFEALPVHIAFPGEQRLNGRVEQEFCGAVQILDHLFGKAVKDSSVWL